MAKKKKRYKTQHGTPRSKSCKKPYDSHHLCYTKRSWSGGALSEIRRFHYCIMQIPRNTLHREIHKEVGYIPVPKYQNAKDALAQLRILEERGAISDNDPLEKRLCILAFLFDCCDQPTADGFRKQLEVVRKFRYKPP